MTNLTNLITAVVQNAVTKQETMSFSKFFDFLDGEFDQIKLALESMGAKSMSDAWILLGKEYIDPSDITIENIDQIQASFDWLSLDLKKHRNV
jgi:hypothetical protein